MSDDVKGEVGVKEDKEEVEEDDDTVEEEKEGCGEIFSMIIQFQ